MEYNICFSISEKQLVKNIFFDYYKDSSNIKYICNKKISHSICCICLEKLDFTEKRTLKCGHYFHKTCIDTCFLNSMSLKCPYCKQVI